MKVQHFVLTRFNLRIRELMKTYEWHGGDPCYLEQRFKIFERYCLPSMRCQSGDFKWLVFFSSLTPEPFRRRAENLASETPCMEAVFVEDAEPLEKEACLSAFNCAMENRMSPDVEYVIQSRIDNDDAYNVKALSWIYERVTEVLEKTPCDRFFVIMPHGNVYLAAHGFTQRYIWNWNHFPSMVVKRGLGDNVFGVMHPHIRRLGLPVYKVCHTHCWLEVVTGTNAKNDFRPYCPPEYLGIDGLSREFAIKEKLLVGGFIRFLLFHYLWARLKWTFVGKRADGSRSRIGTALFNFMRWLRGTKPLSARKTCNESPSVPKVTVVVPVHNVKPYLLRCLDSLAFQSLREIEVICVDDGSTDGSSTLLDEYVAKDRRFTVIHKSHSEGAGRARNDGMAHAKGEYLHFCDSDDFCSREMLAKMYFKAKTTDADVVIAGKTFVDPNTGRPSKFTAASPYPKDLAKLPQPFTPGDAAEVLFTAAKSVPWDKLFRRKFTEDEGLRFQDIHRSNDIYFTDMALALSRRIAVVPEALYMYSYRRDGALTGTKDGYPMDTLSAYDALSKSLRERGLEERFSMSFAVAFIGSMLANLREYTDPINLKTVYPIVRERLCALVAKLDRRRFLEMCGRFAPQAVAVLDGETPERLLQTMKERVKPPKVSVIVPVYNVQKYLHRCLDAILGQTLREIEIICVDDGSTDGSLAVLHAYKARDARIMVLHQANAGAGAARNAGLDKAAGEYLFFFDPDDSCEKDMLEIMYRRAKKTKADIVVAGKKVVDAETGELIAHKPLPRRLAWFRRQPFSPAVLADRIFSFAKAVPWDKLFRRAFVEENQLRFMALPRSNDVYFVDMSLALAKRIALVRKGYYHYSYRRGGSLTFAKNAYPLSTFEAYSCVEDALRQRGVFATFAENFAEVFLQIMLVNLKSLNGYEDFARLYTLVRGRLVVLAKETIIASNPRTSTRRRYLCGIILANESPDALWLEMGKKTDSANL